MKWIGKGVRTQRPWGLIGVLRRQEHCADLVFRYSGACVSFGSPVPLKNRFSTHRLRHWGSGIRIKLPSLIESVWTVLHGTSVTSTAIKNGFSWIDTATLLRIQGQFVCSYSKQRSKGFFKQRQRHATLLPQRQWTPATVLPRPDLQPLRPPLFQGCVSRSNTQTRGE